MPSENDCRWLALHRQGAAVDTCIANVVSVSGFVYGLCTVCVRFVYVLCTRFRHQCDHLTRQLDTTELHVHHRTKTTVSNTYMQTHTTGDP
eukprot:COSAG05_NODE_49_length_24373_cov_16.162561_19_plen_91_part_00